MGTEGYKSGAKASAGHRRYAALCALLAALVGLLVVGRRYSTVTTAIGGDVEHHHGTDLALTSALPLGTTASVHAKGSLVPWVEAPPEDVTKATEELHRRCGGQPNSYEPLGEFTFYGKLMNETSSCPVSGMNNQFTMVVALFHCALTLAKRGALPEGRWKWKDISCSPTGGREGKVHYAVGSNDYEYAWFRWSEVFDVPRGLANLMSTQGTGTTTGDALPLALCLRDDYKWKEHKEMAACPTNIGGLYGSDGYWVARRAFRLRARYLALVQCFVAWAASRDNHGAASARAAWDACGEPVMMGAAPVLLGIHVRRGDYEHFCRGIVGNSGRSKFRTPPFIAFRANSTAFATSKNVMKACAPGNDAVIAGLRRVMSTATDREGRRPMVVAVATNAPSLVETLASALEKDSMVTVASFAQWMALSATDSGAPRPSSWPTQLGGGRLTTTDAAMLDVALLSAADYAILNRYSTFSQTAIDERIIRNSGSLDGYHLYWW